MRVYDCKFVWGNNEKRRTLKGRRCAIIARGKKNSIMVEFEDGQREVVSRYSVKRRREGRVVGDPLDGHGYAIGGYHEG